MLCATGLSLNMARGKPCAEQLDLSNGLFTAVDASDYTSQDGTDCRNYGGLTGLPQARRLFGELLGAPPEQTIVAGNASLTLIHDTVARAVSHGVPGGAGPWGDAAPRFICPCPGYDRHFTLLEHLGVEMLPVAVREDGPDMEAVEELAGDPRVKGIICVPKYSNPTGAVYSDEIVRRLASMKCASPDFRIIWDNAYAVHDLVDDPPELMNVLDSCREAGNPDRPIVFGSTSKITFAGAGVAAMAASPKNVEWMVNHLRTQTIGPDKLNQLRHVRFLRDAQHVRRHMHRHAEILRPKFSAVLSILSERLAGKGLAEWTEPQGGYFISLDVAEGCAKKVVSMTATAGVQLTPAGATFPYGEEPQDRNIRIAPTFPPLEELTQATHVLAVCAELAAVEKQLEA